MSSKCIDGVVLVSDSRQIEEYETNTCDKIFQVDKNVVIAGAGTSALLTKLKDKFKESKKRKNLDSFDQIISEIECILKQLRDTFPPDDEIGFDALLGIKDNIRNELRLFVFDYTHGIAQEIHGIKPLGHGEQYGAMLLKGMWTPDKTMKQTVAMVTLIINMIDSYGLDTTIDGITQAYFIPYSNLPHFWHYKDKKKNHEIVQQASNIFNSTLHEISELIRKEADPKLFTSNIHRPSAVKISEENEN